jgi:phosphatidylserine/phosphatidylglycerophosphate/cardiolipin synthase-like enzyme
MTSWRRTIRTNPRAGVRVNDVLSAALTAELLNPSPDLWLVSPWVSDIVALDNRDERLLGAFDESYNREIRLSEVLARLAGAGCDLHIAVRPDDHNDQFLDRLQMLMGRSFDLHRGSDLHEKTLCGFDWLITGSMNFTWRGLEMNDEAVTYTVDRAAAAQARLDLEHRWSA